MILFQHGHTVENGIQVKTLPIRTMFYSTRYALGHFSGTFSAKSTQKHSRGKNSL